MRSISICKRSVLFRPNRCARLEFGEPIEKLRRDCAEVLIFEFNFISSIFHALKLFKARIRTNSLSIDRKPKSDKLFRSWCGINFLDVMAFLLSPFESASQHFHANPRIRLLHKNWNCCCCYERKKNKAKSNETKKKLLAFIKI